MTTIGDIIDNESLTGIAKTSVKIGNVYRIKMNESNGITPKNGSSSRNKFFIVLGFDDNGIICGGVIINSNINQNVPQSVKDWQMPIKHSKYSFLEHDSFVDCSKLKTANIEKFSKWKFLGVIESVEVRMITSTIKGSPNETAEHLSLFGL